MKRKKGVIAKLCILLIMLTCINSSILEVSADNQHVDIDITQWTLDEANGYIYAISVLSQKLLFIRTDNLQIEKEIDFNSMPYDIELKDSKLYIPIIYSKKIVVVDIKTKSIDKELNLIGNPYKIAIDGDKLFYVAGNTWCNLYEYNLANGNDRKVLNYDFHDPDIVVDENKHTLYVGESGYTGNNLFSVSTSDYTITQKARDSFESRMFDSADRGIKLDGQDVFYAGSKFNADNVSEIRGSYPGENGNSSQIAFVKGSFVISSNAVFDRNKYVKISDLPINSMNVLMDSQNTIYLFDSTNKTIIKENVNLVLNSTQNHKVIDNKLILDKSIDNWVYDDTNKYIYAISSKTNKLLYIKSDDMTVKEEKYIGSWPSDIKLANGKIYISLSGATKIVVAEPTLNSGVEEIYLNTNPLSIAVSKDKLFYTDLNISHCIWVYDFSTKESKKVPDLFFQYTPNITIDEKEDTLYAGDQTITFAVRASDYSVISKNDSSMCVSYYDELIVDNGDLFCNGYRINGKNLMEKKGNYLYYEQGNNGNSGQYLITYVKGNYVFSKTAVYDKNTYVKVCDLPEPSNKIIMDGENNVFMLDSTGTIISKVELNLNPNDSINHRTKGNKLLLGESIKDWVFDEDKGYIYAISMDQNKLLYIRTSDMMVKGEKLIGSLPTDIALYNNKIYICLSGATSIAVTGTNIESEVSMISLSGIPNRIEVGNGKLFFTVSQNYSYIVNCCNLASYKITNVGGYYNRPDIKLDKKNEILYIGDSDCYGKLHALRTTDFEVIAESNNVELDDEERIVLVDGDVYFAKSQWDPSSLRTIKSYNENIIYAKDQYVFTNNNIFDKNSGEKVVNFPSNKSLIYICNDGNKFIYDSNNKTILKFRSIEPKINCVEIISPEFDVASSDGRIVSQYSALAIDQYDKEMENESVTWAVYNSNNQTVDDVKIIEGELRVGVLALPGKYSIKASSNSNNEVFDTVEFKVDDKRLSNVLISGNSSIMAPNDRSTMYNYSLSLRDNNGKEMKCDSVEWDIFLIYNDGLFQVHDVSINSNGELSINTPFVPGDYLIAVQINNGGRTVICIKEINITQSASTPVPTTANIPIINGGTLPITVKLPVGLATTTPTMAPTQTPTSTQVPVATPTPTSITIKEKTDLKPSNIVFSDSKGHWSEQYLLKLLEKGIINGYPDNTIKPDNYINRAELVVTIVKALNLKPDDKLTQKFNDEGEIPDWAKGYLQIAIDKGIIKGYEDGTFRAYKRCSRSESVVMLLRAFGLGESNIVPGYSDFSRVPTWAKRSVSKAIELGIVNGYSDSTFRPDKNITRAEAFTILLKCLDKK